MKNRRDVFLCAVFLSFFLILLSAYGSHAEATSLKTSKPWIGVTVKDAGGEGERSKGVVVEDVIKGGPAEKAGLKADDVITGINGKEVYGAADFVTEIRNLGVGTPVALEVDRAGQINTVEVMLASMPAGLFRHGGHYADGREYGEGQGPRGESYCQQGGPSMMGRGGMMGGMGMMEEGRHGKMLFMQMPHILGLTPEQMDKVKALKSAYMKKTITAQAEIKVAEVELHDLASAGVVDLKKVKAKLDDIAGKKAELRFYRFKSLEDFKNILTPEQRKKMDDLFRKGGMMGMGPMGAEVYGSKSCVRYPDGGMMDDNGEDEGMEEPAEAR